MEYWSGAGNLRDESVVFGSITDAPNLPSFLVAFINLTGGCGAQVMRRIFSTKNVNASPSGKCWENQSWILREELGFMWRAAFKSTTLFLTAKGSASGLSSIWDDRLVSLWR
jgi:hypothetical protein